MADQDPVIATMITDVKTAIDPDHVTGTTLGIDIAAEMTAKIGLNPKKEIA